MIYSTIYDVAVRAGVSVATVSRTFAKPDIVTEATRKKVIEAANELDFAISRSATALKSKRTFRIAMLTGEAIATWFDSNLYKGLTEVLQTHGYDVSLYGIADTEQRMSFFDELPLRRNVDAVIVASFNVTMEEISNLQGMGVPLIGVNVPHNEGFNATVSIDNAKSMRMAINHLHALGHRRIAYICIDVSEAPMEYSADSRLQRFESACAAYEDIEQLTIALPRNDFTVDEAIARITVMDQPPTALCCLSDGVALPLLYKLPKAGIGVPNDMSLIGFDDSDYAAEFGLTTIHQDPQALGRKAAEKALSLIDSATFGIDLGEPFETARTFLTIRNTTAAPRR